MPPLSTDDRLARSRKQALLAVLVAVIVCLAWWNSSLIKRELAVRHVRRSKEIRVRSLTPVEPVGRTLPEYVTVLKDKVRLDPYSPHQFSFSPDTNSIAYFDLNTLWCQCLPNGPPTKLDEISDQRSLLALHWNNGSNRVFYAVSPITRNSSETAVTFDAHVSSLQERGSKLTAISSEMIKLKSANRNIRLTEDARHVVGTGSQPFVWNVAQEELVVCYFDILVPSATSDRWLGAEIDTGQLLIVDQNFEIVRRIDYFLTHPGRTRLMWSPDERYASVTPTEHVTGVQSVRVDLSTGYAESIAVDYGKRSLAFTGDEGELFYNRSVDQRVRQMVTTIPMRNATPRFGFECTSAYSLLIVPSSGFRHVAVAEGVVEERERYPSNYRWQIVDQTGSAWPLDKKDGLLASYAVLGFANNGQTIVAYGDERIVSIPLEFILER